MKSIKIAEKFYLTKVDFNVEYPENYRLKYRKGFANGKVFNVDNVNESNRDEFYGVGYVLTLSKQYDQDLDFTEINQYEVYKIIEWLYENEYNTAMFNLINFMKDEELIKMYSTPGKHDEMSQVIKTRYSYPIEAKKIASKITKKTAFDFFNYLEENHSLIKLNDYNRVSAESSLKLSDEDKIKILTAIDSNSTKKLNKAIEEVNDGQIKMTYVSDLMKVNDLNYNFNRANVSFNTVRPVTLTNIPKNKWGVTEIKSNVSRQYTLILNGQLNVKSIEVYIPDYNQAEEFNKEFSDYISQRSAYVVDEVYYRVFRVDLDRFAFLKAGNVKPVKYSEMADMIYRLESLKYQIWEYKQSHDVKDPIYDERTKWLKELGINGDFYTPKTTSIKSGKFIDVTEFTTKLMKCSSNPDRAKIKLKIKSGKELTPKEMMVRNTSELLTEADYKNAVQNKNAILRAISELKVKLMLTSQELIDDGTTEFNSMPFVVMYEPIKVEI